VRSASIEEIGVTMYDSQSKERNLRDALVGFDCALFFADQNECLSADVSFPILAETSFMAEETSFEVEGLVRLTCFDSKRVATLFEATFPCRKVLYFA